MSLSLFFLVSQLLSGQIIATGKFFREIICQPGEKYIEKIIISNPSEMDIELWIWGGDFKRNLGKSRFLKAGTLIRSSSSFFKIPAKRILLQKQHKIIIPFEIIIPKETKGSYFSVIFIESAIHNLKQNTNKNINLKFRYVYKFVITIEGGTKDLEIENIEVNNEKNLLYIDVKNIGTDFMILKCILKIEKIKSIKDMERFYPNSTIRFKFDISQLENKLYENVRIIFDDGDEYLKAKRITFRKGEEEKIPDFTKLVAENIARKRRRGKPLNLGLSIGTGSRQKLSANLVGNISMKNLSLSFGGYHSEYFTNDFNSFRISSNWRPSKHFSCGIGTMAFLNDKIRYTSMVRSSLSFKTTRLNIGYGLEYKILNLNLSQRLFKKFSMRLYYIHSPWRRDWQANIFIPIL